MVEFGGSKMRVCWAYEDTPGTFETSGFVPFGRIQGSPSVTGDNAVYPIYGGGRINPVDVLEGHLDLGVNIEWYPQDASALINAIGNFDTTSPVTNTSNYKHLGATEDSTSTTAAPVEYEAGYNSISFGLDGATDDVLNITGAKCNNLTITSGQSEPLKAVADYMFLNFSTDTSVDSYSELTQGPWSFVHQIGALTVNGSATADVTELGLSVSNNLSAVKGMGSRKPTTILQGNRKISGNVNLNYDTTTELKYWMDNAASPTTPIADAEVKEFNFSVLYDNNVSPTTGATYRALEINIKNCKLGQLTRTVPSTGEVVTESYSYEGREVEINYWDATSSDPW